MLNSFGSIEDAVLPLVLEITIPERVVHRNSNLLKGLCHYNESGNMQSQKSKWSKCVVIESQCHGMINVNLSFSQLLRPRPPPAEVRSTHENINKISLILQHFISSPRSV